MTFTIINRDKNAYSEQTNSEEQSSKKNIVKFKEASTARIIKEEKLSKQPGCSCFGLFSRK